MVPSFIYGTAWKEERTAPLVRQALEVGFRAIDTANQRKHYFEAAVGEALRGWPRDQLWLQTKFTHLDGQDHRLPYQGDAPIELQVTQSFESSLQHLGTDYLDSYVLHGPSLPDTLADEDWRAWRAMGELLAANKTRALGVSNVSLSQLRELWASREARPSIVQNRCYARRGWDREVRAFCRAQGIHYQGFSLLTANQRELMSPQVRQIVARTGGTLPQVVFRFAVQLGMIPLTGSSSAQHLKEDLACLDFTLEPEELSTLERLAG